MLRRTVMALIALASSSVIGPQAYAVDGCALALCLVKGASGYNECKPILKEFFKDTALGKPPPICKKVSAGNNSGSATSSEQYATATSGANVVASGTPDANPYGDAMSQQYNTAQSGAVEAAASATQAVNAGARSVDASSVLSSDNGSTAMTASADATLAATTQVNSNTACLSSDSSCYLTPTVADIDPDIAAEAQAELDAEAAAVTTL